MYPSTLVRLCGHDLVMMVESVDDKKQTAMALWFDEKRRLRRLPRPLSFRVFEKLADPEVPPHHGYIGDNPSHRRVVVRIGRSVRLFYGEQDLEQRAPLLVVESFSEKDGPELVKVVWFDAEGEFQEAELNAGLLLHKKDTPV